MKVTIGILSFIIFLMLMIVGGVLADTGYHPTLALAMMMPAGVGMLGTFIATLVEISGD